MVTEEKDPTLILLMTFVTQHKVAVTDTYYYSGDLKNK